MGRPATTPEAVLGRLDMSDPDACWLWPGTITASGYGQISVKNRPTPAHRYVYEHLVGPVPPGLALDHLCRVRSCCNPAHLEPVTLGENVLRGVGISAVNARKTACKRGHSLTDSNVYVRPDGQRNCRACHREANRINMRRYYAEKRAAS